MDNPVAEEAIIVEVEPTAETNNMYITFSFAISILFKCIHHAANQLKPLSMLWFNYYQRIFREEAVIKLPLPVTFIIVGLYAFAEIRSQGSDFPFRTHPGSVNIAITSLLFYGLVSVAEQLISATGIGLTSVYAIIAQLGRIGCLCILVTSLASLFYL